ncbi:MAG: hypothetical protein EXS10_06105 [Phycisphaerales bacterium]|nr:hypothetical protein [Phycisphaerales bacterium]
MNNRSIEKHLSSARATPRRTGVMLTMLAACLLSLVIAGRASAEGMWVPKDLKVFISWLMTKDEATAQEQFVMAYIAQNPIPLLWSSSMQEEIRRMYQVWKEGPTDLAD